MERLEEQRQEIIAALFLLLFSCSNRILVVLRSVMTTQRIEDLRYGNLHRDVHTALQVKTQVDLFLAALLQRVTKPNLLGCNRVIEKCLFHFRYRVIHYPVNRGLSLSIGFGFSIVLARSERERQIVGACQEKTYGQNSN